MLKVSLSVAAVAGLLAGSCFGQSSCNPVDLIMDASTSLSLTPGDCRLRDATGSNLTPDAKAKVFRISSQAEGVFSFSVQSASFDPAVYFQDADSRIRGVASGKNRQGNLTIHVPKGTSTLIVSATTVALGDFQITASFETPRKCEVRPLVIGETEKGNFPEAPCRELDMTLYSTRDLPLQLYSLKVSATSVLTIEMNSGVLDSYVALLSTQNMMLGSDDNSTGGADARLLMSVPAGGYLIRANSQDGKLGGYNLLVKSEQPRQCPAKPLESDTTINSKFNPEGCRYLDLFAPSSRTSPVERYEFANPEKGWIELNMTGSKVQPSLMILDGTGAVQTRQTSLAVGERSQIIYSMKPGVYNLFATTVGNLTNEFLLTFRFNRLPNCPVAELPSAQLASRLTTSNCRVLDYVVPSRDAALAAAYKVSGAKPRMLRALMQSKSLDTYLYLLDNTGAMVLENDDDGGGFAGTDSLIDNLILDGDHLLVATTFDGDPGEYSIEAKVSEARNCFSGALGVSSIKASAFTTSDCLAREAIPYFSADYKTNLFSVTVPSKGVLNLSASSASLPLLVIVFDEFYQVLGLGLSSTGGTVEMTSPLPSGKYNLGLFAPPGRLGDYRATVDFRGDGGTAPQSARQFTFREGVKPRVRDLTYPSSQTPDEVDVPFEKIKRR